MIYQSYNGHLYVHVCIHIHIYTYIHVSGHKYIFFCKRRAQGRSRLLRPFKNAAGFYGWVY